MTKRLLCYTQTFRHTHIYTHTTTARIYSFAAAIDLHLITHRSKLRMKVKNVLKIQFFIPPIQYEGVELEAVGRSCEVLKRLAILSWLFVHSNFDAAMIRYKRNKQRRGDVIELIFLWRISHLKIWTGTAPSIHYTGCGFPARAGLFSTAYRPTLEHM
jgi:hypothetical protein